MKLVTSYYHVTEVWAVILVCTVMVSE